MHDGHWILRIDDLMGATRYERPYTGSMSCCVTRNIDHSI